MLSGMCEIKLINEQLLLQRRHSNTYSRYAIFIPGSNCNFAPLSTRFVAQHVKNQDRYDKVHTQSLVFFLSECLLRKFQVLALYSFTFLSFQVKQGNLFNFCLPLKQIEKLITTVMSSTLSSQPPSFGSNTSESGPNVCIWSLDHFFRTFRRRTFSTPRTFRISDLSRPDLSRPDLSRPDLSRPDLLRPDLSRPGLSSPGLSRPDLSRSDVVCVGCSPLATFKDDLLALLSVSCFLHKW
jgi:hypothetical protein